MPGDYVETVEIVAAQERSLTKTETRKVVWELSAPTLVEMFLVSLTGMADMIQVGRVGPAAITSIGLTNQPIMILHAVFQALSVGTTALVARFIGMNEPKKASDTFKQTLVITALLGSVFSVLAGFGAKQILAFMGAEPDVLAIGTGYFQVVGFGFVFSATAMGITSALRGAGDTRTPMVINLFANGVNVVFNYLLIFGKFGFPELGVLGAGVATVFSRIVACAWFLYVGVRGERNLRLDLKEKFRPDLDLLKRIFTVGTPAAIEQLIMRTGQVVFAKVIAGLGTVVFAAHQVALNALSLSFMPGNAFAVAATTLVGQYLGANRPDDAEQCANTSRNMSVWVGIITGVIFIFFGKYITLLYSDDLTVVSVSAYVLRIYAIAQPAQAVQFVLSGGLRGAGDTIYPLYSTAIGMWFGRVLLAWILVQKLGWGLPGAWVGMCLDQVVRGILIHFRFKTGKWKTITV